MKKKYFLAAILGTLFIFAIVSCNKDDEDPYKDVKVQFESNGVSVSEAAGTIEFDLTVPSGAQNADIIVEYDVTGTAVEGEDYTFNGNGSYTIPSGELSSPLSLTLIDNVIEDGERTIVFTISGATIGDTELSLGTVNNSFTITITDDECSPYIVGDWNYEAIYISFLGTDEVPANQGGQGLLSETLEDGVTPNPDWVEGTPSIENPEFTGTITISDTEGTRSYTISDAVIGQYSGLTYTAPGQLMDDCGEIHTDRSGTLLLFDAFPVVLEGVISEDGNTITVSWSIYMDLAAGSKAGRGEATLTRAK